MKKISLKLSLLTIIIAMFIFACAPADQVEKVEEPQGLSKAEIEQKVNMNMSLALEHYKNREYADAIPLFLTVIRELEPDNSTAYKYLAYSYLKHENEAYADSAIAVFQNTASKYNEKKFPFSGLGYIYLKKAEYDSAKYYYHEAVVRDTTDTKNIESFANLLLRDAEYDSAITIFELGTRQDPDNIEFWERLAELYKISDNDTKLVEVYQNLTRINPENASYLLELGQAYARTDNDTKAVEMLESYVQANPADYRGYRYLGNVKSLQGKYDEAIKNLEKAIELAPDNPRLYCDQAQAYIEKGQTSRASRCVSQARKIDSDYAYAFIAEGDILTKIAYEMVSPEGELEFCTKKKFEEAYNKYKQVANDKRWGPVARARMRRIDDYLPTQEEKNTFKLMGRTCD
ncbi:MAG: tetratricopeptide repeat protein [Candidatus Zixiibacteriota bacterium]